MSYDVAIIGAGISGLSAALKLVEKEKKVLVLEKERRVGGVISTEKDDGFCLEMGPNTVLLPLSLQEYFSSLPGLQGKVITASSHAKKRFIVKKGNLYPLPSNPLSFLFSPLFSWRDKLGILKEPFLPPSHHEESIAAFARRRLGNSFYDYAVGPFVSGVYAGDGEALSIRWAATKIYDLEKNHGSLIKGAIKVKKGPEPPGTITSCTSGLQTLPEAMAKLVEERGGTILLGEEVTALQRENTHWLLKTPQATYEASKVLLTGDARHVSTLLQTANIANHLDKIPYAGVVVLSLGYKKDKVGHSLDGFGFLTSPVQDTPLLGCLFPSSLFPHRAPEGYVLLTCFLGGARHQEVLAWDDRKIMDVTLSQLTPLLTLKGEPEKAWLHRWERAIPQYNVGHGRFVQEAEEIEKRYPTLTIGGNLLYGVSMAKCITWHMDWAESL